MRLHDYQKRMADFICDHPAAALWAEVGLGKTAATLTALRRLVATGEVSRILVIAPKRVAENVWQAERDQWTPDVSMSVAAGDAAARSKAIAAGAAVTVLGRDNVVWAVNTLGKKWPFDCLVIDESHSFKDQGSQRFKALRRVIPHHQRTILLSATPASESLMGLWAQIYLADRGQRLGKAFTAFRTAFFEADYMGYRWGLRNGSEATIHARIADMSVSMRAQDYLTLPERIDQFINVVLSPSERRQYEQLERDYLLPLAQGEAITALNAGVLFGKLAQLSGGAVYDEDRVARVFHTRKLDALTEIIEAACSNPVLVFYGYLHERDRVLAAIPGAEPLAVERWNAGKQRVALAHAASAGAGLNLQAGGHQMVWYSIPPSLELYTQACGRLHRQGQSRPVVIHHLITQGTIDETIAQMLRDKATGQNRLIDALTDRAHQWTLRRAA